MKTDSDYLWDKTGEPDPQIQQLEEILGTLRDQPRPLEIPAGLLVDRAVGREQSFFRSAAPRLAIAATLAMLLLGFGVWFAWQRSQSVAPSEVAKSTDKPGAPASPTEQAPKPDQNQQTAGTPKQEQLPESPRRQQRRQAANQSFVAANSNRIRNEARKARELREAALAKDQLLLALRVTSAKLSFAQKKTQSTNSPEPVHNQHKIG